MYALFVRFHQINRHQLLRNLKLIHFFRCFVKQIQMNCPEKECTFRRFLIDDIRLLYFFGFIELTVTIVIKT